MKKFNLFFALVAVSLGLVAVSCKNDEKGLPDQKSYAEVLVGKFGVSSSLDAGMLQVKSQNGMMKANGIPVAGNVYEVYKKLPGAIPALVDGSEFLPGSDAALDWAKPNSNPIWFDASLPVYYTYCPVLPLRFVIKGTVGAVGSQYSYLGITDLTPTRESFPLQIQSKRLGDKFVINVDALRNLPGYKNLAFKVSYTKSIIDVNKTALESPDTKNGWPVYSYSSTVPVVDQLITGSGDVVVYDGYDAKITGDITIKVIVDNTVIAKITPSLAVGKSLKAILKTDKVGWYDSGTLCVSYNDITVEQVIINVN